MKVFKSEASSLHVLEKATAVFLTEVHPNKTLDAHTTHFVSVCS